MKKIFLILIVWLAVVGNVSANDSIGALGAGGIEFKKTNNISMEKEVLTISPNLVRVEYVFVNHSDKEISERVFFPMPFTGFDYGCSPEHHGDLSGFKLWVNEMEIMPLRTARARLKSGKDIYRRLADLGFLDEEIVKFRGIEYGCDGNPRVSGKYANSLPLFIKEGLADSASFPMWEASYIYYWEQKFPPKIPVRVVHEYAPFVGTGSGRVTFDSQNSWGQDIKKKYCMTKGTIRKADEIRQRTAYWNGGGLAYQEVNYVLTTGANWAGPIKDFTLVLKKQNSFSTASLCFEGNFKKANEFTLISNLKNFVPKQDLQIIFLFPYEN